MYIKRVKEDTRYILVRDGGFIPSVHPVANPTRYYSTSITLSVDYKPLHFTPPIFTNIDAHKEGVTFPTVYRTSETTQKNLAIQLRLWSQRPQPKLPPGSIKPQLDPQ